MGCHGESGRGKNNPAFIFISPNPPIFQLFGFVLFLPSFFSSFRSVLPAFVNHSGSAFVLCALEQPSGAVQIIVGLCFRGRKELIGFKAQYICGGASGVHRKESKEVDCGGKLNGSSWM